MANEAQPFSTRAANDTTLRGLFVDRFKTMPRLFRAPGRINIIGEHTDYSGGLAMPAAIDRSCTIAASANDTARLRVHSLAMNETAEVRLDALAAQNHWVDYVVSVALALQQFGRTLMGCDMIISSDVPIGAGVSSSASLAVATAMALSSLGDELLSGEELRRIAWKGESLFSGAPCGPLDHFASVFGQPSKALLMDCRTLSATPVAIPADLTFIVIDSGVRHRLRDGGYAQRRRECEAATSGLGLNALRDAEEIDLSRLPPLLARRARHVVRENARVIACAIALENADPEAAGRLMAQSHASLKSDFDVTCPETDALAAIANETQGVFGARQMGGGFGGGVLALVDRQTATRAGDEIERRFRKTSSAGGGWFACDLSSGAREVL